MAGWLKSSLFSKRPLGPLETALLRDLQQRGDATVRELVDSGIANAAYTTVMTTLDRLYKKGLLDRAAEGRAFRYRPSQSAEEVTRDSIATGLRELLAVNPQRSAPLSFLVDEITKHDAALLNELERAIDKKRRELRNKESE